MGISAIMQPEPRSFASGVPGLRRAALAKAKNYWWGALVNDDLIPGLIRDIEGAKGRQSVHEAECALRYKRIEENTTAISGDLASLASDVKKLVDRGQAAAWSVNWKAWMIAATLGATLVGALAWTSGQLYGLEPLRVQHETKK